MRFKMLSLGLVLAAAIAFTARGQPVTTLKDRNYPGAVEKVEGDGNAAARRAVNIFGRCVARTRTSQAEAILALPLQSTEQNHALRRTAGGVQGCLGAGDDRSLRFLPPVLTAALAEYMVTDRMADRDVAALAGLTDARIAEMGAGPRNIQEDIATCFVARDPLGAAALARTEPESVEEGRAIARLAPHLGPCLPEGATFSVNRTSVRLFAAAGLYRLLAAQPRPPGARSR